jgi:hypothetical protein
MRPRLLLLAICACASATVVAQVRHRPTETGPWRPWSFTAAASTRQSHGATVAEVKAFENRLQELVAIIKRAPAVSPPIGFAAEAWGSLSAYDTVTPGRPPGRAVPLSGEVRFAAFQLIEFMKNGKLANEDMKGGETETVGFLVNKLDGWVYHETTPDGLGSTGAFVEPEKRPSVAGLDRLGDAFVVRKNPKPLWVPFPLGEALQPIVAQRRTSFEARRDNYAKEVAEFMAWKTPEKRAARRADWQKGAALMPKAQAAEFLANMEKTDPQIEAAKEAQLKPGGPDERGVRDAERELQEAEGIQQALSAEDKQAPSCYDHRATRLAARYRLREGAPPSCRPLVRASADYFDPKLPRSTPQIVMVQSFERCLRPDNQKSTVRGGCAINRELIDTMDWDAVRAWLDR